jgi:beta-glucosidase
MHIKSGLLAGALLLGIYATAQQGAKPVTYPFQNTTLSFEARATDLVSRLTLQEKIALMQNNAKPVERLGIPAYNWWNECLHGVARDGVATVFPQAIGMAAAWDTALIHRVADVISTEARAKHEEHVRHGERNIYQGLTMWTPNINIFRDPRWGRGQETYGEDPYLTGTTGVAFVKGLQGSDPKYFKVIATAKHYAVHSGSEYNRHIFDAQVSKQDMFDTYLPAFGKLVKAGKVYSVMGAYNRVNGVPACANHFLLDTVLRQQWGFNGYVVSDCGAISDIYQFHKYVPTKEEASAVAVKAGCDLTCGGEYISLAKAVSDGLITEQQIDVSVRRLMLALFKLGIFDSKEQVAYQRIPFSENNSPAHDALSKTMALESMVLLQNKQQLLPLSKQAKIAVVGPYHNDVEVLWGNYNGMPDHPVSFLQGIRNKLGNGSSIITADYLPKPNRPFASEQNRNDSITQLVNAVAAADVVVFCGGISASLEGEESPLELKGFFKGDRTSLDLPEDQLAALKALKAAGKKVVLVLTSGSALALNWENDHLDAIVEAWYPGQQGGSALADVLFGDYNPGGRLPVTFYKSVDDLPPFEDYNMTNRTYRYFTGTPLYPFGYGLSYTRFAYRWAQQPKQQYSAPDVIRCSIRLSNTGNMAGDEVPQVYIVYPDGKQLPLRELHQFKRVHLEKGRETTVEFAIPVAELQKWDAQQNREKVYSGQYGLYIGAHSADKQLSASFSIKE